ncbi:uncharacterized protein LOC110449017 [Mizuhopecten yessoensis]|uniref:Uncharacterized protein n=1 Tax=Mizuhopecten yessoensis TaxID=6573 RepID=A0A210QS66_MIZYE|nr:uncharacterized protein LOC110449017 [Mizuhopecten yessoensis]XP_021351268.1 uncharacterized protein LOC110449017 [Mizuhopecten yessoensis]OWF51572.1 hypothetical protein KP79_PYT24370 [Mizuhopecten yessoensis]
MPISSGALGWPRSHWAPPPRPAFSKKKVYPHAVDWARQRAEELRQRRQGRARKRDKTRKKMMSQRDRRKLKKRFIIAIIIIVVLLLLGAAGFLVWWFIFKDNPNCSLR